MADQLGQVDAGSTINIWFTTHSQAGGSVAPSSAFEAADVKLYKNGSSTERSSTSGWTMTSPFDAITGLHLLTIDLSDNTDAGFYAAGARYAAVLSPDETVDGQTVVKVLAVFSIGPVSANVTQWLGTAVATPVTAGVPTVADVANVRRATAQAGSSSSITLDASASATTDFYVDQTVTILSGTGAGQTRMIRSYNGTTKVATITPNWQTNPDSSSVFLLLPTGRVDLGTWVGTTPTGVIAGGYISADVGSWGGNAPAQAVLETSLRRGTAQAGAASTITLDASASAIDSFYVGQEISITSGSGVGQARVITAYNGTTKVATVSPNWLTNPSSSSVFVISPRARTFIAPAGLDAAAFAGDVAAAVRAMLGLASANLDTQLTAIDDAVDTEVAAILAAVDTETAAILAAVDTEVATILAAAADIQSRLPAALSGGKMDSTIDGAAIAAIAAGVFTTQMAESYAAVGVEPTLGQAIYFLIAAFTQFAISANSITAYKLDGVTPAASWTMDSASTPTTRTRIS